MQLLPSVLAVIVAANSVPQVGRIWSFEERRGHADVVVIATAVEMTDTGRKSQHPSLRPRLPVVELETVFEVLDVIKQPSDGQLAPRRRLTMLHYRMDIEQWRAEHPAEPGKPPPGFVNAGGYVTFTNGAGPYVLYLKRSERGFEPVTGHVQPEESVFALVDYLRRRRQPQ